MIKKINIIGTGNVATHLALHLHKNLEICTIYSRDIDNANTLAKKTKAIGVDVIGDLIEDVDLNIVAIKDDSIHSLIDYLPKDIPVVHTSGTVQMEIFNTFETYGILYPLQTFSKDTNIIIEEIPFLIEGNSKLFTAQLSSFCKECLSPNYHLTNSTIRSEVHLAAVISNNFITALLSESERILENSGLSLDILKPLLKETLKKSFDIGPLLSQTGPAKRGDTKVIETHMNKISNPKLKEVYRLLSEIINEKSTNF